MPSDPVNPSKPELRQRMRALLATVSLPRWTEGSGRVCDALQHLPALRDARTILLYAPMTGEIDISRFARHALTQGKVVTIPRVDWARGAMEPARIEDWDDPGSFVSSRHGVREPAPHRPGVPPAALEAVVAPGLAFAERAGLFRGRPGLARLGRGGGFYDRFLAQLPASTRVIGVALDAQVVPDVPTDPWDAAADIVVTPARVLEARYARTSATGPEADPR